MIDDKGVLAKNIIQLHKQKGTKWLNDLPDIVENLAITWSLSDIEPVNNMSWHYVAFAKKDGKTPVVLKVGCDEKVSLDEYRALKYFEGRGAVRLLDYDAKYCALLLERALPGNLLIDKLHNIEDAISIYANTINTLLHPKAIADGFVHVSHWCKAIDRITDPRISQLYIDLAQKLRSYLFATAKEEYVCHGDLHCENVIHHQDNWIVIDPKGIVGEVAFETAAFDLLSDNELKSTDNLSDLILFRTKLLAEKLNIDHSRLLYWVFLRVIISAQWFIEDGGDPSKMLGIAENLYPLVVNLMVE